MRDGRRPDLTAGELLRQFGQPAVRRFEQGEPEPVGQARTRGWPAVPVRRAHQAGLLGRSD
ncbi:hypothetical protein OG535_40680 [Kitasatospora sp. NBC_00085]